MTRNNLTTNFMLTGVGGQGTLLAADIVGLVGMQLDLDVKKSEVHGMAQRGGSVISHVRWGERVHSPLIAAGEVDYLIAFERLEALRYASLVRPGGVVLVNDYRIAPVSVSSGNDTYPDPAAEEQAYGDGLRRFLVPAIEIAQRLGQARVNNIVLLGALSHFLPAPVEVWLEVISGRVPERTIALNREAFTLGRAYMQG
jgi:indolepyruvate ferredoxin oxidoreductase beta subunit